MTAGRQGNDIDARRIRQPPLVRSIHPLLYPSVTAACMPTAPPGRSTRNPVRLLHAEHLSLREPNTRPPTTEGLEIRSAFARPSHGNRRNPRPDTLLVPQRACVASGSAWCGRVTAARPGTGWRTGRPLHLPGCCTAALGHENVVSSSARTAPALPPLSDTKLSEPTSRRAADVTAPHRRTGSSAHPGGGGIVARETRATVGPLTSAQHRFIASGFREAPTRTPANCTMPRPPPCVCPPPTPARPPERTHVFHVKRSRRRPCTAGSEARGWEVATARSPARPACGARFSHAASGASRARATDTRVRPNFTPERTRSSPTRDEGGLNPALGSLVTAPGIEAHRGTTPTPPSPPRSDRSPPPGNAPLTDRRTEGHVNLFEQLPTRALLLIRDWTYVGLVETLRSPPSSPAARHSARSGGWHTAPAQLPRFLPPGSLVSRETSACRWHEGLARQGHETPAGRRVDPRAPSPFVPRSHRTPCGELTWQAMMRHAHPFDELAGQRGRTSPSTALTRAEHRCAATSPGLVQESSAARERRRLTAPRGSLTGTSAVRSITGHTEQLHPGSRGDPCASGHRRAYVDRARRDMRQELDGAPRAHTAGRSRELPIQAVDPEPNRGGVHNAMWLRESTAAQLSATRSRTSGHVAKAPSGTFHVKR